MQILTIIAVEAVTILKVRGLHCMNINIGIRIL